MGDVRRALDAELFFEAPARLKTADRRGPSGSGAPRARARRPTRGALRAPTPDDPLWAGNEVAGIEIDRHRLLAVRRPLGRPVAFAREAFLGPAQRPAPALAGAPPLRQLAAALRAVAPIFALVNRGRLGEDPARDPAEVAAGSVDALAAILVPPIATTPTVASPARAHGPSTPQNTSPGGRSCRQRNSAIAE
jgi:hypothetical protein